MYNGHIHIDLTYKYLLNSVSTTLGILADFSPNGYSQAKLIFIILINDTNIFNNAK